MLDGLEHIYGTPRLRTFWPQMGHVVGNITRCSDSQPAPARQQTKADNYLEIDHISNNTTKPTACWYSSVRTWLVVAKDVSCSRFPFRCYTTPVRYTPTPVSYLAYDEDIRYSFLFHLSAYETHLGVSGVIIKEKRYPILPDC